jgi:uncharacterized membrane protein AbrB (regulator of aidB expression)
LLVLEDKIEYRLFHFFGDEVLPLQIATYLLIIIFVNLRISLESHNFTGNRKRVETRVNFWEEDKYIHASVILSILVPLAIVVITHWSVLPPSLLPFLFLASVVWVGGDYVLFKIVPLLIFSRRNNANKLKTE